MGGLPPGGGWNGIGGLGGIPPWSGGGPWPSGGWWKKHLSENVTDYSQIFTKAGPQEQVLSGFSGTSTLSRQASQFSSLGV